MRAGFWKKFLYPSLLNLIPSSSRSLYKQVMCSSLVSRLGKRKDAEFQFKKENSSEILKLQNGKIPFCRFNLKK